MSKEEDIIKLPHYVSKTRTKMSKKERAAKFSPHSAMTRYRAGMKVTQKIIERKIEALDKVSESEPQN